MFEIEVKKGLLGSITKSSSTVHPLSPLNASVERLPIEKNRQFRKIDVAENLPEDVRNKIEKQILESRKERYFLQRIARFIFISEGKKMGLEYPASFHRTAMCHCRCESSHVSLNYEPDRKRAYYSGLLQCRSIWSCPICAPVIQAYRCVEVGRAMDWAYENGFKCILITFTFSHTRDQVLSDLLKRQSRAYKKLRGGRAWKELKKEMGFEGLIRALEVTHGKNGWHPHTHEIWIVDRNVDVNWIKEVVLERWLKICKAEGLVGEKEEYFREHSVDVIDNASASSYIAKMNGIDDPAWGADRETTKTSMKKGNSRGRSLFEILAGAETGYRDRGLYLEFSKALKGKRQLYFSPGLKERVGLEEVNDEDISIDEETEKTLFLALIEREVWKKVVLKKEARAEILELAENGDSADRMALMEQWFSKNGCFFDWITFGKIPIVKLNTE